MRELSKNDWRVLAQLLEMAEEIFHEHGCNDFELDNTLDNFELVGRAEQREFPQEPIFIDVSKDNNKIYTGDSLLMGYFASIARENAE